MNSITRIAVLLAVSTAVAVSEVRAEDLPVLNIKDIDCREMLKMNDDEQDFTLVYFHGFMSGKKAQMMFDGPNLLDATDKIMDACIDHPEMTLLEVFEKNR